MEYSDGNLPTYYDGDITITGLVSLAGACNITGSLTIESGGVLTHPLTSSKSQSIDLQIEGGLEVKDGGTIEANEKSKPPCTSSEFRCDIGKCVPKGYIFDGDNDCGDNSDERGDPRGKLKDQRNAASAMLYNDFRNPDSLGNANSHNAGGRIAVQTSWLKLDGSIEAMGHSSGAGGSVNIKVMAGGAVTGSGKLDVSV